MDRNISRLSEHFSCLAFSRLPLLNAVKAQEEILRKYGEVEVTSFCSLKSAIEFLLPLKTFTRRYLLWQVNDWSIICSDMIGEWCFVDVYAHSRMTMCSATAGVFLTNSRRFCYMDSGRIQRRLVCDEDGDRWVFRSEGILLPLEDSSTYGHRIRKQRLTPSIVEQLLTRVTGVTIHSCFSASSMVYGLERSWKDLRTSVEEFQVENDLFEAVSV